MSFGTVLNAMFGYNQAMNERLWTIIMEHVSDEQFVQAGDYSHGSIRNEIVHMANAQHYWLRVLLDQRDLPRLAAEAYPTRAEARAICQQADQEILDRTRALSEAELERVPDGWVLPVWAGLMQVANHSTDHRALILRALHDLGAPTFEQSFVLFMEQTVPMSVEKLAGLIGDEWAAWEKLLGRVPAEQMDQPLMEGWTVRDGVAIVTWKDSRTLETIRKRALVNPSFGEQGEAERAAILEAGRALPLPELLDRQQAMHREMLDALQALPDEALTAQDVEGLPDEPYWKAIAWGTWWGYPALSGPLRELLDGQA